MRVPVAVAVVTIALATGGCSDATGPLVSAVSGHSQAMFTIENYDPRWERLLDFTLRPAPGGGIEGSAWSADRFPTAGSPDFTVDNAYSVRGWVVGDRVVLSLTPVEQDPLIRERYTYAVTLRADGGELHAALPPTWQWKPWQHATGPLVTDAASYGTGVLTLRKNGGPETSIPASIAPLTHQRPRWAIGSTAFVGLQFPAGRPTVGTYRIVPAGPEASAGPRDAWVTVDERCYNKSGCSAYRTTATDTGEVVITIATPTRTAGTYRVQARGFTEGGAATLEHVVASGTFDVPCLASDCR